MKHCKSTTGSAILALGLMTGPSFAAENIADAANMLDLFAKAGKVSLVAEKQKKEAITILGVSSAGCSLVFKDDIYKQAVRASVINLGQGSSVALTSSRKAIRLNAADDTSWTLKLSSAGSARKALQVIGEFQQSCKSDGPIF